MICEKCKCVHDGSFGSGRFCARACANARVHSVETKLKQSNASIEYWNGLSEQDRGEYVNRRIGDADTKRATGTKRSEWWQARKHSRMETLPFDSLSKAERRIRIDIEQNATCAMCGNGKSWNGGIINFEIDHIDGDRTNEKRSNLRLICPNCHSQTPTYKVRNRSKRIPDDLIAETLLISKSGYEVIKALGLNTGSYARLRRIITLYKLELSYKV